jgi:hypothetical protein
MGRRGDGMNIILAIDPGAHSGVAVLEGGKVVRAYAAFRPEHVRVPSPFRLVIEIPQYYPRMQVRPQSLIVLALNAGGWIALNSDAEEVLKPHPREWKGQVKKTVTLYRVGQALTAGEKEAINWNSVKTDDNIVDAIGLGLHRIGRYR